MPESERGLGDPNQSVNSQFVNFLNDSSDQFEIERREKFRIKVAQQSKNEGHICRGILSEKFAFPLIQRGENASSGISGSSKNNAPRRRSSLKKSHQM
jgi:hypothetical protein